MRNHDLNSGLFGSIGENMVAFELAKRNWYIYRPYFDTRIDFIAQKFICKECFSDWESKNIVTCPNSVCANHQESLTESNYIKCRQCNDETCRYIFDKYSTSMLCPLCETNMDVTHNTNVASNQRNHQFKCPNENCGISFSSQKRKCVKCNSDTNEYPICTLCREAVVTMNAKCSNLNCDSREYAVVFRTIQVKSSHEEEGNSIAFNFKLQDLIDDDRHFLVVYSRTFDENNYEKHNYWVMSVQEFKDEYVRDNASTTIYQNNRLHPPSTSSESYFDSSEYNRLVFELQDTNNDGETTALDELTEQINRVDVFGKLNQRLSGDSLDNDEEES